MPDLPDQQQEDDPMDLADPSDASQWAMHGLLSVYYEADRAGQDADQRADAILGRITTVASARRLALRRLVWWATGLAAAACLALILFYPAHQESGAAFAALATQAALQPTIAGLNPSFGPPLDEDGPEAEERWRQEREAEIAVALADLEQAQAAALQVREDSDEGTKSTLLTAVLQAWTRIYRPLRGLGRWDEAIAVINNALQYASGDNPLGWPLDPWPAICLDDLGTTYAVLGNYAVARQAFLGSIARRKANIERTVADQPAEYRPAQRLMTSAESLPPLYWQLSYLAVLEGDLPSARAWHTKAEAYLRDYFVGVCQASGRFVGACQATGQPVLPNASLLDAFYAAPLGFQMPLVFPNPRRYDPEEGDPEPREAARTACGGFAPSATISIWVRDHTYRETRLRRLEGDLQGARRMLQEAFRLPYYAVADESRLNFFEPLEAARIAITLRDYPTALEETARAARNAGPIEFFDKTLDRLPIGPLPRAELKLLRGAALLGMDPTGAEGRRQAREALALLKKMSAGIDMQQREAFLRQFNQWELLVEQIEY